MGLGTDGRLPLIQALKFYATKSYLIPLMWECAVRSEEQGGYQLPGQLAASVTQPG